MSHMSQIDTVSAVSPIFSQLYMYPIQTSPSSATTP